MRPGAILMHDIEVMRGRSRVIGSLDHPESLADAAFELAVGGRDDFGEFALLASEFHHRDRPLTARFGGSGLQGLAIGIERDVQSEIEKQRRSRQPHDAGAEHGDLRAPRARRQMILHDLSHLDGAAEAQCNASAAMAVIMHNEFLRNGFGVQPVRSVAIGPHARNAGAGLIWIKGKIGCRQIGRDHRNPRNKAPQGPLKYRSKVLQFAVFDKGSAPHGVFQSRGSSIDFAT